MAPAPAVPDSGRPAPAAVSSVQATADPAAAQDAGTAVEDRRLPRGHAALRGRELHFHLAGGSAATQMDAGGDAGMAGTDTDGGLDGAAGRGRLGSDPVQPLAGQAGRQQLPL